MTDKARDAISWAAIGARDAATQILQQVCRPDPDLDEVQKQAQRVNRATAAILDTVNGERMTARSCANCTHLMPAPVDDALVYRVPAPLKGVYLPTCPACDGRISGHVLPLSARGTCEDWAARDGE